jgi:hypothetical protein
LPPGRDTRPAGIAILLQILAALALFVIVRDQRPNPSVDREAWEQMGLVAEFFSIASPAMLFTAVACAAFHAFDPSLGAAQRSAECALILKLFAVGVVLVEFELLYFGYSRGFWEFFGGMAAVTFLDFVRQL